MELNSKPSTHTIISDPQFEQQNQRLQAFREAGLKIKLIILLHNNIKI